MRVIKRRRAGARAMFCLQVFIVSKLFLGGEGGGVWGRVKIGGKKVIQGNRY